MNRWLHAFRNGALALTLAAVFLDCGGGDGDGGGGGVRIRLFFGMNGDGSCNSVLVDVDLADADAILARTGTGGLDCALDGQLASNGCHATFSELGTGEELRVTITGCTIPAVTNLFACTFTEVDISDLDTESAAQCVCTVPGCDGGPPLCIDEDADPRSCENCTNGTDDDGNGLADCDDPNCEHSPLCEPTTSTTSTTGPTVSSTTIDTTTTTTIPTGPMEIHFLLSQAVKPLGALEFTVNYTSAPGRFVGDGDQVACTNEVDGAIFAANNTDGTSKLKLGFISLDGIIAPTPLATCLFEPDTPVPVPANFTVVIDDASDLNAERVRNVIVGVAVSPAP